ncbi:hypothetical protein DY468_20850 [Rhodopseudomonas sp. BR0M22]|nr:hypothetical protein [Rhodopseudomonas sp. BR0M22]
MVRIEDELKQHPCRRRRRCRLSGRRRGYGHHYQYENL